MNAKQASHTTTPTRVEHTQEPTTPPQAVTVASGVPPIPEVPGDGTPTLPFLDGTTMAELPARTEGSLGSPKMTDISLMLTHDGRTLSSFGTYFELEHYLHPLLTRGGAGASDSPYAALYRATHADEVVEGSFTAKEAAARRVLPDTALEACLSQL